jgi:hypothetical protein
MALCGQDEGGSQRRGGMRHPRRQIHVDLLDGEEATSHTRGEASSHLGRPAALERCRFLG